VIEVPGREAGRGFLDTQVTMPSNDVVDAMGQKKISQYPENIRAPGARPPTAVSRAPTSLA
jgi:hypothetical protein